MKNMKLINLTKYIDIINSGIDEFKGYKKYIATGSLETKRILDFELIDYDSRPSRANMQFKKNDIIFAKMKDTEKVYLIDDYSSNNIYSTGFTGLRINNLNKITPKYLFYWIRSKDFQNEKNRNCTGSTQKAINNTNLKKIMFPYIPLEEQLQITKELDKIDSLIECRYSSMELLDNYTRNLFMHMFGDMFNNSKKWNVKKLKELGKIQTGNTPPRKNPENYGDFIEWIKSDNINTPHMYLTQSKECLSEIGYNVGRIAPKNSVLVTCIAGSVSSIGNVAIADRDVAFNQQINSITPNENMNEIFLYYLLFYSKEYIQSFSKQSLKYILNKKTFEEIPIICPPIIHQNKFSEFIKKINAIKKYQLQSKRELDKLFIITLNKAFKGEFSC